MEALETAFERCVGVLSAGSKDEDVAVEVCTHIVRCYSVSAQFAACRDRLIDQRLRRTAPTPKSNISGFMIVRIAIGNIGKVSCDKVAQCNKYLGTKHYLY